MKEQMQNTRHGKINVISCRQFVASLLVERISRNPKITRGRAFRIGRNVAFLPLVRFGC